MTGEERRKKKEAVVSGMGNREREQAGADLGPS